MPNFAFIPRWLLALITALIPSTLTLLLVTFHLHTTITNFVPYDPNDQSVYWHHILTFSQVGFNGGYYSPDEKIAQAAFSHFGPHGPLFPLIYGSIARFTGWQTYTGLFFNMVFVSGALLIFTYSARLDLMQILATGILIATFWPLLLYMPTVMQESFHLAVAIILAAMFYRLIAQLDTISNRFRLGLLLLLTAASIIRISWALLFLPFFVFGAPQKSALQLLWALIKSAIFVVVILVISRLLSAPTNHSVFAAFASFRLSIGDGINSVLRLLGQNLQQLSVIYSDFNIYLAETLQVVGLAAVYVGTGLFLLRRRWMGQHIERDTQPAETLFHILNLLAIVFAGMILYLADGFDRVFAPHLLLSLLLLISFRRYRLLAGMVILNLLVVGSFLYLYQHRWQRNFAGNTSGILARLPIQDALVYDPTATNVWCNTLVTDIRFLNSPIVAIPAGIGVSYILSANDVAFPLKSHYILFTDESYANLAQQIHAEPLVEMDGSKLYRNLDANCYDGVPNDPIAYSVQTGKPVYLPVDYLKAAHAANRTEWASFNTVRALGIEPVPDGQVIFPPEGLYGSSVSDQTVQFALLVPEQAEVWILPPLPTDEVAALRANVVPLPNSEDRLLGYVAEVSGVSNPFQLMAYELVAEDTPPLATYDGNLELVAVDMAREMQPGEWMPITLYWRLRQTTTKDYFAYVQLWDYNGQNRSEAKVGSEGIFRPFYPTSSWQAGQPLIETRWLRLYDDAPQGGYRLMMSVFTEPNQIYMSAANRDGLLQSDQWVSVGRPVVEVTFPEPEDALKFDAQLDDSIRLTHYATKPSLAAMQPGMTFTLTLYWQAIAVPEDDYIVFVKVRDTNGNIITEQDEPPLNGQYPTGNWAVGEHVATTYTLTIPEDATAPFTILTGMYLWPSLERLPVTQEGTAAPDNLITLPSS